MTEVDGDGGMWKWRDRVFDEKGCIGGPFGLYLHWEEGQLVRFNFKNVCNCVIGSGATSSI